MCSGTEHIFRPVYGEGGYIPHENVVCKRAFGKRKQLRYNICVKLTYKSKAFKKYIRIKNNKRKERRKM